MSSRYWLWWNEYQHNNTNANKNWECEPKTLNLLPRQWKREQLNWIRRLNSQQTATAITQELIIYMLQSSFGFSLDIFIHGLFTAIRVYKEDGCVCVFGKDIVYVVCKLAWGEWSTEKINVKGKKFGFYRKKRSINSIMYTQTGISFGFISSTENLYILHIVQ